MRDPNLLGGALFLACCLLLPCCTSETSKGDGDTSKKNATADGTTKDGGKTVDEQMATELVVGKAAPEHPCHDFEIEVMESAPVRFALNLQRDMPQPGYKVEIGEIALQDDKKTIVAKTTTTVPEGAGLTVVDVQKFRFPLGSLPRGKYVFELRDREQSKGGKPGEYSKILTLELEAK